MTAEPGWRAAAPDSMTPIIGYRVWRVTADPPGLLSLYREVRWPPECPLVAHCLPEGIAWSQQLGEHSAVPDPSCQCGIWALRDSRDLEDHVLRPGVVGGLVILWGRVVVGTRGYRAETARVGALVRKPDPWATGSRRWPFRRGRRVRVMLEDLAHAYGVPILEGWPAEARAGGGGGLNRTPAS